MAKKVRAARAVKSHYAGHDSFLMMLAAGVVIIVAVFLINWLMMVKSRSTSGGSYGVEPSWSDSGMY